LAVALAFGSVCFSLKRPHFDGIVIQPGLYSNQKMRQIAPVFRKLSR
jgi:hypothetical protein